VRAGPPGVTPDARRHRPVPVQNNDKLIAGSYIAFRDFDRATIARAAELVRTA
jgi:hypothetical protein